MGNELERQFRDLVSEAGRAVEVPREKRIFCNRNLRLDSVDFVGFDMDYTLAIYNQEKMEELSIQLTLEKLVKNYGYPSSILDLEYDSKLAVRGIFFDKELGNVFKMDRHGHIGRAFHGLTPLSRKERHALYRNQRINLSRSRFRWIDTLFGLPEAVMFMVLVEHLDQVTSPCDYFKLVEDIRSAIDEAHADGSLKNEIRANLSTYIHRDERLGEALHKFRSAGKRLFVLTNSYYPYTNAVMSYLLDGMRPAYPKWQNYFDWTIVGGRKPTFFTGKEPFLEVNSETEETLPGAVTQLEKGRVYQHGNITDFEEMTGAVGDSVLYIGDHIYGDILKLKKTHVWRTCMVIQELEEEHEVSQRMGDKSRDMEMLDRRLRNLHSEIDYQAAVIKRLEFLMQKSKDEDLLAEMAQTRRDAKDRLEQMKKREDLLRVEVDALEESIDKAFNPYWGSIVREGNANSRFGDQVNDYADLYTARVSNFAAYSPMRYFRAPRRKMPHEP